MNSLLSLIRQIWNKDIILIYNMGKVGSSSIEAQVPNAFHTHTLYGKPPSRPYHELKFGKAIMFLRKITIYPAKRFLFRRAKTVKIVTFIRRPEERNP